MPQETQNDVVAVALSGGVDSAVAAALLQKAGKKIIALTMRLRQDQDMTDAQRIADKLQIPLHILDLRDRFRAEVEDPFVASYLCGETPIPCVRCNKAIKFGDLIKAAREHGASALATGHYVRLLQTGDHSELHKAADLARDQSYFLFALSMDQLGFLQFPLGNMKDKTETRAYAAHFGIPVADKPDSQDICFIPDGDYASFVRARRPDASKHGDIVDEQGHVLGRHEGIIRYTVGQRKGLNLHNRTGDDNEPLYVVRIDAATNRVVVGPYRSLGRSSVLLKNMNWLAPDVSGQAGPIDCHVRLRSAQQPVPVSLVLCENGEAQLHFASPLYGVAPGQAGVLYQGTRLLGGGWIAPQN